MLSSRFRLPRRTAPLVAALACWALPMALHSQQSPPDSAGTAPLDEAVLEAAAKAHLEITIIQERLQMELAQYHDPREQMAARDRATTHIAEALGAHGLTAPSYERVIFAIGTVEAHRRRFEEFLQEAREARGASPEGQESSKASGSERVN